MHIGFFLFFQIPKKIHFNFTGFFRTERCRIHFSIFSRKSYLNSAVYLMYFPRRVLSSLVSAKSDLTATTVDDVTSFNFCGFDINSWISSDSGGLGLIPAWKIIRFFRGDFRLTKKSSSSTTDRCSVSEILFIRNIEFMLILKSRKIFFWASYEYLYLKSFIWRENIRLKCTFIKIIFSASLSGEKPPILGLFRGLK